MTLFKWDNKYSVNIEDLDNQHEALFDIMNKLYNNYMVKDNSNHIAPLLEELVSYTNYHFASEEINMKNKGYKDIDKHISEHTIFKERIYELQQKNKNNIVVPLEYIGLYLGNWLINHVMEEDKKYSI